MPPAIQALTGSEPFTTYDHSKATKTVSIDGHNLKVGDVVAVARHGAKIEFADSVVPVVQASVDFKESKKHTSIYGVTTGFGGSADTRTSDTEALQISLLEHQLCGFLPVEPSYETMLLYAMPIPIVRGAMAVRVNSCVRGHSGVRLEVLQSFADFLNRGLVPCVPLRGTISASGDLSPLSYIAGAICGHPDIKVFDTEAKPPVVVSAPEAIKKYGLKTVKLASKEGLGLINGTAVSAAAGALALYDAECLAMMSQTNTALTVEALDGHVGSFAPFIQKIRPHPGQIDAAKNIRHMLGGSKLAIYEEPELLAEQDAGILRQDRYALRTSAQWIGPQLEMLGLARQQIEIELNSTTDNPLIDVEDGMFHHGGNFQAMAVTSAMDSTRMVLQSLGKLGFAQVTELINCEMNHGLPSNLAGSEPSTNYHCKGLDIHCGAYCAELGFLANPVSNHVQSTEMHNQSVNSMAFVSARKTMEANEVLSLLLSSQMYCATQALDLRVMEVKFKTAIVKLLNDTLTKHFSAFLTPEQLTSLNRTAAIALYKRLNHTPSWDSGPRFEDAAKHLVGVIMDALMVNDDITDLTNLPKWKKEFAKEAGDLYRTILHATTADGRNDLEPAEYLGNTRAVYECVRKDIGVKVRRGDVAEGKSTKSIGSSVARIVEAMRNGTLMGAVQKMFNN